MVTPTDIRHAYDAEARNGIEGWARRALALKDEGQDAAFDALIADEWRFTSRAARKGRVGDSNPGGWRATRSLPSGQPVSWSLIARSALTLAAFLGLVGALVVIRAGTAVIQGRRGRRNT